MSPILQQVLMHNRHTSVHSEVCNGIRQYSCTATDPRELQNFTKAQTQQRGTTAACLHNGLWQSLVWYPFNPEIHFHELG